MSARGGFESDPLTALAPQLDGRIGRRIRVLQVGLEQLAGEASLLTGTESLTPDDCKKSVERIRYAENSIRDYVRSGLSSQVGTRVGVDPSRWFVRLLGDSRKLTDTLRQLADSGKRHEHRRKAKILSKRVREYAATLGDVLCKAGLPLHGSPGSSTQNKPDPIS